MLKMRVRFRGEGRKPGDSTEVRHGPAWRAGPTQVCLIGHPDTKPRKAHMLHAGRLPDRTRAACPRSSSFFASP